MASNHGSSVRRTVTRRPVAYARHSACTRDVRGRRRGPADSRRGAQAAERPDRVPHQRRFVLVRRRDPYPDIRPLDLRHPLAGHHGLHIRRRRSDGRHRHESGARHSRRIRRDDRGGYRGDFPRTDDRKVAALFPARGGRHGDRGDRFVADGRGHQLGSRWCRQPRVWQSGLSAAGAGRAHADPDDQQVCTRVYREYFGAARASWRGSGLLCRLGASISTA
jgi:hypothetical protein